MFEDLEFDATAGAMALLGGLIAVYVTKSVETGLVIKLLSFVFTTIVCYMVVNNIRSRG